MLTYNEVSFLLSIAIIITSVTMYVVGYICYRLGYTLGEADKNIKKEKKVVQRRVKHMRY